nr:MAG TPA: Dynactin subunit 1, CAP-Gly domain-containing PROTEIN MICROTUBULE BINDING, DYNACTIN.6A [Caudoviricetes sp.]
MSGLKCGIVKLPKKTEHGKREAERKECALCL